jgi:hypothetical protein
MVRFSLYVDYVVNVSDGRILFQSFHCCAVNNRLNLKRLPAAHVSLLLDKFQDEHLLEQVNCKPFSDTEAVAVATNSPVRAVLFGTMGTRGSVTRLAQLIDDVVGTSEWLPP